MQLPIAFRPLAALSLASLVSVNAQTLPSYQAVVASQSPTHYFKLDNSLADSVGAAPDFGVIDTGGGYANDFFGNPNTCRFFSNLGDALTNATDLINGGGPVGGDPAATNRGSVTVLFHALDDTNNTGQRFVFSQGTTSGDANAFALFFENDTSSSSPNSLKLRVGNLTTSILPAAGIRPNAWYFLAVTYDENRSAGEVDWHLGRLRDSLASGTIDTSQAAVVGNNGVMFLGNRESLSGGFRNPGDGRVDEFAVWDRELSPAEINAQFDTLSLIPESVLWTDYMAHPDTATHIPNCSYAGYRYGEVPLPDPQTNVIDVTAAPYHAVGDGVADDTDAIRAAITNAGVIYFPDGTYNCSGVLFVHKDNTILRGQSRSNTVIRFTQSLQTGYACNSSGTSSRWSWTGGMIMFCPESKNTYLPTTNDIGGSWSDGWSVGSQITTVTGTHPRGSHTITVANGAGLSAGQFVFIRVNNATDLSLLEHYCGDEGWAENYDWSPANSAGVLPANRSTLSWPVEIANVNGNSVTLRQPLRTDLRAEWSPQIRASGAVIRECGLENLTVQLARDYTYVYAVNHNKEPGWNGPWFNNAFNCFLRGVTVVDPDNGALISAGKNITLTDFRLNYTASNRRAHHHGTVARAGTQDCLWEDFAIATEPRHGIHVESFSAGNVWSRGTMDFGTFDNHKALPYECLRTEITINNTGTAGGAADAGPRMGARFVHWNVLVTTNRNHMIGEADLMPFGAIVGVRGCTINSPVHPEYGDSLCAVELSGINGAVPDPVNLYEAQKSLRLGATVAPSITLGFLTNGFPHLRVVGAPYQTYVIQTAPALTTPASWLGLNTNASGSEGRFDFTDLSATNHPGRFYRAVR